MNNDEQRAKFLADNNLSEADWDSAGIDWSLLQAIAEDHKLHFDELDKAAQYFAQLVQRYEHVHSVRWRVKDPDHLMAKIVRKRAAKIDKYSQIDQSNYSDIITDLVGVRILHLFKEDCLDIGKTLTDQWIVAESPVAYIRAGDTDLTQKFIESRYRVEEHNAGYRSIHYVFKTQPARRVLYIETQVRTIFEEGWSEIDHRVRYPNFSDNPLIGYFLQIFNRLAGSADEMGGFVRRLAESLETTAQQVSELKERNEASFNEMETLLVELRNAKENDKRYFELVTKLSAEIDRLKGSEAMQDQALVRAGKLSDLLLAGKPSSGLGTRPIEVNQIAGLGKPALMRPGYGIADFVASNGLGLLGEKLFDTNKAKK